MLNFCTLLDISSCENLISKWYEWESNLEIVPVPTKTPAKNVLEKQWFKLILKSFYQ